MSTPEQDTGNHPGLAGELLDWAASATGRRIAQAAQVSGGNRCQAWALDAVAQDGSVLPLFLRFQPFALSPAEIYSTRREAEIYAAIQGTDVPAPRLVAVHPTVPAMLMQRVEGSALYRRLTDDAEKTEVARQAIVGLARLHALDAARLDLPSMQPVRRIAEHVRAELDTWRAMYDETGQLDPLVEFGFRWLYAHLPQPDERPVLVHGDAGPGNFMFRDGALTALIDWELGHLGDPMEDLAWFSMRSVMEPVPDFPALVRAYAAAAGRPVDVARIRYHRVVVSQRVVIIRHRNVSGEPGSSLVSRALNRRLLMDAIADASGRPRPEMTRIAAPDTAASALFDGMLDDLRDVVVPRSKDAVITAKAKDFSRVLKFLRETDRIGQQAEAAQRADLATALGARIADIAEGEQEMARRLRAGSMAEDAAFAYFASQVARDIELARGAMGGMANRSFPDLA